MNPDLFLVILIIIGLIGRSPIISTAASLLLILKLTHLERFSHRGKARVGIGTFVSHHRRPGPLCRGADFRQGDHFHVHLPPGILAIIGVCWQPT